MRRIIADRMSQRGIANGADEMLFGISLPSDSVVHGVNAFAQLIFSQQQARTRAFAYAIEGWILPVIDPESAVSLETLFDQLVPKDTDVQTMDLDVGTTDATPFYEPGLADWTQIIEVGLQPERIFHANRVLTFASPGSRVYIDPETPFDHFYTPTDQMSIQVRQEYKISQPSVLVFALGLPVMGDTTSTPEVSLSENGWFQIKYLDFLLERMMIELFGLTESGSETPWEEAADLLQVHVRPPVLEDTAGAWAASTVDVFTQARIDHSVIGELPSNKMVKLS